jgi:MMPL family
MGLWQRLAVVPTGRRSAWLVVVAWLALGAAAGPLARQVSDVYENDVTASVPHAAESTRAPERAARFPGGQALLLSLGATWLAANRLLGFPAFDHRLVLIGFVFLVALGVDCGILLMTRVREEADRPGHRPGVLRGLAATGSVITSAGLVLAATFAVLSVLPVTWMVGLGVLVAVGVLLDTFVVRPVLVPALALDAGPATWWPSRHPRGHQRQRPVCHQRVQPRPPGTDGASSVHGQTLSATRTTVRDDHSPGWVQPAGRRRDSTTADDREADRHQAVWCRTWNTRSPQLHAPRVKVDHIRGRRWRSGRPAARPAGSRRPHSIVLAAANAVVYDWEVGNAETGAPEGAGGAAAVCPCCRPRAWRRGAAGAGGPARRARLARPSGVGEAPPARWRAAGGGDLALCRLQARPRQPWVRRAVPEPDRSLLRR